MEDEYDLNDEVEEEEEEEEEAHEAHEHDAEEEEEEALPAVVKPKKPRAPKKKDAAEGGEKKKKAKPRKKKSKDGEDGEPEKKRRSGGGLSAPMILSSDLAAFCGAAELSRPQVVKKLWEKIKERDLQDPSNRRRINCDADLQRIFKLDSIDMFQMNKILSQHLKKKDVPPAPPVM